MALNAGAIATTMATLGVVGYVTGTGVSGLANQLNTSPPDSSQQSVNASSQPSSQSDGLTGAALTTPGSTNSQRSTKTVPEPPATLATVCLVLGAGILLKVLKRRKALKSDAKQYQ